MEQIHAFGDHVLNLKEVEFKDHEDLVKKFTTQLLEMVQKENIKENVLYRFGKYLCQVMEENEENEIDQTLEAFFKEESTVPEVIAIKNILSSNLNPEKRRLRSFFPRIRSIIVEMIFIANEEKRTQWMLLAWIHASKLIYYPWAAELNISKSGFDISKIDLSALYNWRQVETQKKSMDEILRNEEVSGFYARSHLKNKFTTLYSWRIHNKLYILQHPGNRTLKSSDVISSYKEVRNNLIEDEEIIRAEGFFKYCLNNMHRGEQYLPDDLFREFLGIIKFDVKRKPIKKTDTTEDVIEKFIIGFVSAEAALQSCIELWRNHLLTKPNIWRAVLEEYLVLHRETKNSQLNLTQKARQILPAITITSKTVSEDNGQNPTATLESFADRLKERHMTLAKTKMIVQALRAGWWTYHVEVLKKLISIHSHHTKHLSAGLPMQQAKLKLTSGSLDQKSEDDINRFVDESYDNAEFWEVLRYSEILHQEESVAKAEFWEPLHHSQILHEDKSVTKGAHPIHASRERLLDSVGMNAAKEIQLWWHVSDQQGQFIRNSLKTLYKHEKVVVLLASVQGRGRSVERPSSSASFVSEPPEEGNGGGEVVGHAPSILELRRSGVYPVERSSSSSSFESEPSDEGNGGGEVGSRVPPSSTTTSSFKRIWRNQLHNASSS